MSTPTIYPTGATIYNPEKCWSGYTVYIARDTGVALVNNRYRDELEDNGIFIATVNTPAFSAGMGIKMRNIELVGEYTYNRFDTRKFDSGGETLSYNWDYVVVRVGISFGRLQRAYFRLIWT